MGSSVPIPSNFTAKKDAILASLVVAEPSYRDLSPKGSVDEATRPLIERINALQGVVTTSSCAGRVSVFLEGSRHAKPKENRDDAGEAHGGLKEQAPVPGGKGMGGRWLFVSHSPVHFPIGGDSLASQLGMFHQHELYDNQNAIEVSQVRFARFQFEPMILHIMTASLHHAQPILAAAINAGFRESGIQSLKNLDDVNAFPMVAIRSSGLALESIIGCVPDRVKATRKVGSDGEDYVNNKDVHSLVSESYLNLLLNVANDRFKSNTERMRRFESDLFEREATKSSNWENSKTRQERKRAEGLKQQEEARKVKAQRGSSSPITGDENLYTDEAALSAG